MAWEIEKPNQKKNSYKKKNNGNVVDAKLLTCSFLNFCWLCFDRTQKASAKNGSLNIKVNPLPLNNFFLLDLFQFAAIAWTVHFTKLSTHTITQSIKQTNKKTNLTLYWSRYGSNHFFLSFSDHNLVLSLIFILSYFLPNFIETDN